MSYTTSGVGMPARTHEATGGGRSLLSDAHYGRGLRNYSKECRALARSEVVNRLMKSTFF